MFENISHRYFVYTIIILVIGLICVRHVSSSSKEGFFKRLKRINPTNAIKKVLHPIINKGKSDMMKPIEPLKKPFIEIENKIKTIEVKHSQLSNMSKDAAESVAQMITKSLKKFFDQIKRITDEVDNISKAASGAIENIAKRIGKATTSIGQSLYTSIIFPFNRVFIGLGNMFVGIFGILLTVIMKIIELPLCIPRYIIKGIGGISGLLYKELMPRPFKYVFSLVNFVLIQPALFILYYLLVYPLNAITSLVGFNFVQIYKSLLKTKCFEFNINKEIKLLRQSAKQIVPKFKPINIRF